MKWFFERTRGASLRRATNEYLRNLATRSISESRQRVVSMLQEMAADPETILIGDTTWGQPALMPVSDLLNSHGFITGGTGSGKTTSATQITSQLVRSKAVQDGDAGLIVFDAKGDLFAGGLYAIKPLLDRGDSCAEALADRVVVLDFGSKDPVSQYNILAPWPGVDLDYFSAVRADLIFDLLPGPLSLPGASVLKRLLALLASSRLPLTFLSRVIHDASFCRNLVDRCGNRALIEYFRDRFPDTPKATLAAIERRIDALLASESVRLVLSGTDAPDFRRLQDEAAILFIKCFGASLSRGVQRLLQAMVLSDLRHGVFSRSDKTRPSLVICDESQNLFLSETLREQMNDLLTMSRSFRTHFVFITQNLSVAVPDSRILRSLHTNVRWSMSFRSEPADTSFLTPALPVTGRKVKPQADPFDSQAFLSPAEERAIALHEIASLPDRTAYLWLKSRSPEAFLVRTRDLDMPSGEALAREVQNLRKDPAFGKRLSRDQYNELVSYRDSSIEPRDEENGVSAALADAYQRTRKGTAPRRTRKAQSSESEDGPIGEDR